MELLKRFHLEEINQMCRAPGDPLAPKDETLWPSRGELDRLSGAIRDLASLYSRGGGSTWSCILAIQNKRPSLKLQERIEGMVDRASKLCRKLPRAIEIARQAKASVTAKACIRDLQRCYSGEAEIATIKWDKHGAILAPRAAKGETYGFIKLFGATYRPSPLKYGSRPDGNPPPGVFVPGKPYIPTREQRVRIPYWLTKEEQEKFLQDDLDSLND